MDHNLTEYITQPGDTLWDLACEFGTTVEELMDCNPGMDPDNLYIGQAIGIPETYDLEQRFSPAPPWREPWRRPYHRWGRPWRRPIPRYWRSPWGGPPGPPYPRGPW